MQHNTPTRWAAATVIALGLTACSSAAKPEVASLTNPATAASQLVTTTSAAPAPPTSSPLGSTPDADPAITSTASTNSTNATGSTVTAVAPTVSSVLGGTAPRERLDMTDDDRAALYQPYNQCLADNGVTSDDQLVAKQQADVVTQTCQPLYPLPPWEYDP
ncbi:MAG: hypothetical protein JWL72_702, partial [Ilumatobacteraceae bacterium]|nr:hypothetical protein [Ilumatobacteraceae bacterium]